LYDDSRGQLKLADFGLARRTVGCVEKRIDTDSDQCDSNTGKFQNYINLTPKIVSLWYRPPEVLLGSNFYDERVDTWSAGCVIGELLLGIPLIQGKSEVEQLQKMFNYLGPPDYKQWLSLNEMPLVKNGSIEIPQHKSSHGISLLDRFSHISSAGIGLLENLLRYDFRIRWTAKEAFDSRYFRESPMPTICRLMPVFPKND